MDLERVKTEALGLPIADRIELAQALIKSFHPQAQAKPKVIDSENLLSDDCDFQIEPDPVVTVAPVTEAPRRITIPDSELAPEPAAIKVEGSSSISEAFHKLRRALEAETES